MNPQSRYCCKKCGKLLFLGEDLTGNVQVTCRRCKTLNVFAGEQAVPDVTQKYPDVVGQVADEKEEPEHRSMHVENNSHA